MDTRAMRHAWKEVPTAFGTYRVEPLRFREAGEVARLERLVFLEPLPWAAVSRKLLHAGTTYAAVRDGSRLAAYFGFEVWGAYAHVLANVTHPDYRRQGLAAFLLRAMEPVARAGGARGFLGEVRESNRGQQRVLTELGWGVAFEIPAFFANGETALIVWRPFSQ